jgi:spore coat protein U-like protein
MKTFFITLFIAAASCAQALEWSGTIKLGNRQIVREAITITGDVEISVSGTATITGAIQTVSAGTTFKLTGGTLRITGAANFGVLEINGGELHLENSGAANDVIAMVTGNTGPNIQQSLIARRGKLVFDGVLRVPTMMIGSATLSFGRAGDIDDQIIVTGEVSNCRTRTMTTKPVIIFGEGNRSYGTPLITAGSWKGFGTSNRADYFTLDGSTSRRVSLTQEDNALTLKVFNPNMPVQESSGVPVPTGL